MNGSRPQPPAAASPLATALDDARRGVAQAARRPPDSQQVRGPATACAETWQLIHLLGSLGDLATTLAPEIGAYPRHYLLHADDGVDPARHLAHACRDLATLRRALGDAENAARDVYAALSHLTTLAGPGDSGLGWPGATTRGPGGEGS